jgi:hypothetical protein
MLILREPVGSDVHAPPCFVQNEQLQARAGISVGSGNQFSSNEMLPQWQLPQISMIFAPLGAQIV